MNFDVDEPQSQLDMITAQSDAHNFDAALNNYGLQPVNLGLLRRFSGPTSIRTTTIEQRSVQWSHNCADVAHAHTSPPDAQL